MHDDHDDHDDYAHDYDHTEVDHDQDGLDDKMPHNDNNPVEEGSKLHLEIHRAVDELGKYAIELDIHNKELSKETIKGFIDEMMRQSADDCFRHGADLIGHIKAFYKIDNVNDHTIMFSMVDPSRPTNIQDQIPGETVIGGLFVLHVIVHGIWDDVIRECTLEVLPEIAKIDLLISMITLKYTQSNSVCYCMGGQTIGVGAGQQSRIACTRLAGTKADNYFLRMHEKVTSLPFIDGVRKCDADNAIDLYISDDASELFKDGVWQRYFTEKPEPFTKEEKEAWHKKMTNVALGSDAFFPFEDNIERAVQSGVKYIAQPGGSVRDQAVIDCCDEHGIAMAMTGIRLFHH